ncbi:hypothetical protein HHK36_008203 [Tetracentron sinense]|uniref:non-specific serine/threonine protein kinase n=1 Tax=Tetracentron sinense TaxID=13715 RepID=A0A835DJP9_TETSI|nr:hypothetical protein HHK36_008203 [Tetracentron sinense]
MDTVLVVGLAVGGFVLVSGVCLVLLVWWKKRNISGMDEEEMAFDISMNNEFEHGKGPKRFSYGELVRATNNFAEEGKLGQGGFGAVYRGLLSDSNLNVVIKDSKGSEQGRKEYISEVKIIRKSILSWGLRYKIALGLASALLYLHEEWEECVVHRDIKSSNVMLDSTFNTKLGDFGLARLIDHELGAKTIALAGNLGYMALEYIITGKAGKESDVFSFGVVALENAYGRKSIRPQKESRVSLVAWVWEHYGRESLFDAANKQLVTKKLNYSGDAEVDASDGVIQLTKNRANSGRLIDRSGRAVFSEVVQLWDSATGTVADFNTHFSFKMMMLNPPFGGDGLAFFLAPNVAVEFDTYQNEQWDPSDNHVGINVNSIQSVTNLTWDRSMHNASIVDVWISYNSSTKNLSVFLTSLDNPISSGNSRLSYQVDLMKYLPEQVTIGFSASTGWQTQIHNILSWEFNSTEFPLKSENGEGGMDTVLVVGLAVGGFVLISGVGLVLLLWWKKRIRGKEVEDMAFDMSMNTEFENGKGPKRFSYGELVRATKNFAEEGKLGQGGFGAVYRGILTDSNLNVAVKVSKGSEQGRKEYISEVKIISRLRHRNLVQLMGWCHERGEFLLVYEFMPNNSLDSHLFGGKNMLSWGLRYKIALGLASALFYLHEESEECVVHRDIKSSNVMLDSNFNTKLGDFGLARLMDHEHGPKTTALAGTLGYMAPEYISTGKASKESDVFSFGVVALEIACGRKSIEPRKESQVSLVAWVWELYGRESLFDAADERLCVDYDMKQMEYLMIVGLWCAHPDYSLRPSIRQAIQVLNFEGPLPDLPTNMPVPMYHVPSPSINYTGSSSELLSVHVLP